MSQQPMMQALQLLDVGKLSLTHIPRPVPGPQDVLIRTLAATICTSDLHDIARNPFNITLPRVLGHEASGVIVECGSEVNHLQPGTRVAAHPVVPCRQCTECRRNYGHLCSQMGHLGYDRDGAFAEYFVQRADRVRAIPDSLPSPVAALLEPVCVCLQAIHRSGPIDDREVLIVGDGPFGNVIARLAQCTASAKVTVSGREPFRLARIPNVQITRDPKPRSADVAILAVASNEAVQTCLTALRPRGRLVIFSALPDAVSLDLNPIHLAEQEIVGSCNDEERLDEALTCLLDPQLKLHEIITHQLPLAQWPEAFRLAREGHDQTLKVALTFPESS